MLVSNWQVNIAQYTSLAFPDDIVYKSKQLYISVSQYNPLPLSETLRKTIAQFHTHFLTLTNYFSFLLFHIIFRYFTTQELFVG